MNVHHELEARLGPAGPVRLNDLDVDATSIRALMINEVVPADPAQDFYGSSDAAYASSALSLLRPGGIPAESMADALRMGIYVTNAAKTPKAGYAVDRDALALSLPWLEQEIALFPNVQVIMLMGDVAKKMYNAIARKTDRKNPIPSGATYRLRQTAFYRGDVRIMPSYIMTGGNILIEKSKVTMAAEDVARMAEILRI